MELEDKKKFLNVNGNSNNKEKTEKEQTDKLKKNEPNAQEIKNINGKGNKIQNEPNQNLVASSNNIADTAREKKPESGNNKDSGNIMNKEVSKIDKNKTNNKKGNNEACKCAIF